MWVDNHDEAYNWAKRKRFEINPRTGTFQIWTHAEVKESPDWREPGVFERYTREQLLELGVPEDVLPVVYNIRNEDELHDQVEKIPNDVFLYLLWLLQGEPIEDVLEVAKEERSVEAREERERSAFLNALIRSGSEITVISSDLELEEMMRHPLETWRLFLHPSQKKLIEADHSGPVRVLGGAGTGKTVVALHRARKLVRDLLRPGEKLLVTAFNLNLAEIIRDQLASMCTEEEMNRIDVIPIDQLARNIAETHAGIRIHCMMGNEEREALWKQAGDALGLEADEISFIRAEYERFILPEYIEDKETYLRVMRKGRKKKLTQEQREKVWDVVQFVESQKKEKGWYDYPDILRIARRWAEAHPGTVTYRAAVIDEAQDFTEDAFCLIRALVPKNRNDLFIVGDPLQRLYNRPVVLSRCGIDVRGQRSKRLRINYRTTEQIRKLAVQVLVETGYDDLDGGVHTADDFSLMSGAEPVCLSFAEQEQEKEFIVRCIRELQNQGVKLNEMVMLARISKRLNKYREALEEAGIPCQQLTTRSHLGDEGVHFGTMHRSKGLEFRVVFLVGVNEGDVPFTYVLNKALDDEESEELLKKERSLLYVASSRAREKLFITSHGRPSPWFRFKSAEKEH
ncbi:3'-5' exonuclease [Staphylospora marina]|uniref:3'-5' exonuclease n=1 Tax=Staphylospora marina TaxID=2490858 RepID=UPI000F5BA440|nr:3'-5' exonuclease [Staphylospora marina]